MKGPSLIILVLLIMSYEPSYASERMLASKVKKFVQQTVSKTCSVVVGRYVPGGLRLDPVPGETKDDPAIEPVLWCITDFTEGEGTIHEKSGCALVDFNLNNNNLYPPYIGMQMGERVPIMAEGKTCKKGGGFEALMKLDLRNYGSVSKAPYTIKELLSEGDTKSITPDKSIFLYASVPAQGQEIINGIKQADRTSKARQAVVEKQEKTESDKKILQKTEGLKNIEGIWLNNCVKDDPGPGMSFSELEKYDKGRIDIFRIYFNDNSCGSAKSYVVHIIGSYKTGDFIDRQQNIKAIDLVPQKYEVMSLNEESMRKFNEDFYLGYMDWKDWTPKDVSRNKDFRNKVGKVIYSIFKLDGEKSYGPWPPQEDTQSTPAKRALLKPDMSKPAKRQSFMPHNFEFGGMFK